MAYNHTEPLVYLNGLFQPRSQAHLSLHDAGFVMGATVTDMCRTFGHRLFRWREHLTRFAHSCRATQIYPPLAEEEISARAEELVAHNADLLPAHHDLALVLFATPGPIGFYLGEDAGLGDAPVTFGMHTFPLPFARYRRLVHEGARLVVPTVRHVPAECVEPRIKQRSRMHWWLADRAAHRQEPGSMALLLDRDGCVTETGGANFLIVKNGRVLSPMRGSILEGVSLAVVRELCNKLKIPFEERPLTLYDCQTADEAMLASTPYCLVGVSRIQSAPLPFPGTVFRSLTQAWSQEAGLDIHGQILQADQ